MKIEREQPEGRNTFTGYGPGYVEVGGMRHAKSVIVSAGNIDEWSVRDVDSLARSDLASLAASKPEIVLLGTGPKLVFPDPAALADFHAARIGIEVMDTQAACRTYNILLAEGRNVVAALII